MGLIKLDAHTGGIGRDRVSMRAGANECWQKLGA